MKPVNGPLSIKPDGVAAGEDDDLNYAIIDALIAQTVGECLESLESLCCCRIAPQPKIHDEMVT